MNFNQDFVPGWNAIYLNLLNKINSTIITSNVFTSPFSQMLQNMECGFYQEDIHINPGHVLLQNTVHGTDIFNNYTDDLAVAAYKVNIDLSFPSTFREHVVRTGFSVLENVSALINALTANIRTTLERQRSILVKQMLYNAYQYGMLSSVKIPDPTLSAENSGRFVITLNSLLDDFRTEINPRNVIYNNQTGLNPKELRQTISPQIPYIIIFNNFVREAEFLSALRLGLIEKFRSGNSNMDWQSRIIGLNVLDFPTSIPTTPRSLVTGQNVSAHDINFYEEPVNRSGNKIFSGVPSGGSTICGFVLDPDAIRLCTQLSIMTTWFNPASLDKTNRETYLGIMALRAFSKICAVTFNPGE